MQKPLKHLMVIVLFAISMLSKADSTIGGCPVSSCDVKDGCATISVYVDSNKLKSGVDLEGTAMLRTARLWRKEFKELPKTFSVHSSIERADLNVETGIYTYISRYQVADIKEFIAAYKLQKAAEEKAAAERAAAERKAAEEKVAAERAAAERKAMEEKAAVERAAAESKGTEEKTAVTSVRNVFSEHGATAPIVIPAPEDGQPSDEQRKSSQQDAANEAIKNLFN